MATKYPISVILQAIDRLSGPMKKIAAGIDSAALRTRKFNADMRALSRNMGFTALARSVGNVGSALGNATSQAGRLLGKLTLLGGGAAWLFKRQVVDVASDYENLTTSLVTLEGGADKAAASLAFIEKMAIKTPFNLSEVADTYRTLMGFGMDSKNGQLWALTEAMSALGKKGYDLQAVAVQLGQAWGKTKLTMEDVRPMIQRGIPVFDLLVKASERAGKKMTVAQIQQLMSQGKLGRAAIEALLEQMAITYEGGNARMMNTWTGMISNMQDYWQTFTRKVMSKGLFEYMHSRLRSILDFVEEQINNGNFEKYAKKISAAITGFFDGIWRNRGQIISALQGVASALRGIYSILGAKGTVLAFVAMLAGPFILAVTNLAIATGGLAWALRGVLLNGLLLLAAPFANFILALRAGYGAMAALNLVIAMNPMGWFIALLVAVGVATYALTRYIMQNAAAISAWVSGISVGIMDGLWGIIDWVGGLLDGVVDAFASRMSKLFSWFGEKYAAIKGFVSNLNPFSDGPGAGTGPTGGFTPAAQVAQGGAFTPIPGSNAAITVDFTNMPPGTRVSTDPRSTAKVDTNLGYSMAMAGAD